MDLDPEKFFQNLSNCSETSETAYECERLLSSLNRYLIEEQINPSLIENYLVQVFHPTTGLVKFIDITVHKKAFKTSTGKAVEILFTLLKNCPEMLYERNIIDIYNICARIIRSDGDYFVKLKVYELLLLSFEKINRFLESKDIIDVLRQLLTLIQNGLSQKHRDTVKEKELTILGCYAKKFSFLVEKADNLKAVFIKNLDLGRCARSISQHLMSGFFNGFLDFCEHFPLKFKNEDKSIVDRIYITIKALSVSKERRKIGTRAALKFLSKHTTYFEVYLMEDYEFWHATLLKWLNFPSKDDKTIAFSALVACFSMIFTLLERNENEAKQAFEFFNQWSVKIMKQEQQDISQYQKHLAITCINYSAAVSFKYLSPKNFNNIFIMIMQNFEKLYIYNDNLDNDDWEYIPDYIKAIANFMRFKSITSSEYFCLQRGVIDLIKSFHKLPYLHHHLVIDALVTMLIYVKDSKYFDGLVENIVYFGVVWTCSHQHVINASIETAEEIVTVKNYFPLWKGLLKFSSNKEYEKHSCYTEKTKIEARIVKELLSTLIILTGKLNTSVQLKEEHSAITELEHVFQVKNNNDYAIFLNVVDFYEYIFQFTEARLFRKCICNIIKILISKCLQYPVTSGFYKLLSSSLRISKKLCLFENNLNENQDIQTCQETLSDFLIILLNKMSHYKDELLTACLCIFLEAPAVLITEILPALVDPLKHIFDVGCSYISLVEMGLTTLEHWQDTVDPDKFETLLEMVIPSLDNFLRSKSLGVQTSSVIEKRRKTMHTLKKRTIVLELQPELVKLQKRILCFIGRQNIKICNTFIFSNNFCSDMGISGQKTHLKVELPYQDGKLDIYLDTFFPRVINLSLHSSDRRTRIMSCELFQALILLFLGRAKAMNESSSSELDNMLKMFAIPLLQLACDVDRVVQQIFEPLCYQLMHWYSSRTQIGGRHCTIVIEMLLEGITHPTNSALRDFCGKCICEFVKWSIKQSYEKSLVANLSHIKLFVRHMRYYGAHPDPSKNLGAALIFNSIYMELKEEESLISMFWIELLHIFVISLSNIEFVAEENATIIQIKAALDHLERVFIEKPQIFRKSDNSRKIPNDFQEGSLKGVSIWLLKQTSNRNKYCRESCIELFVNIAPLCTDSKVNLSQFIEKYFDKSSIPSLKNGLSEVDTRSSYLQKFLLTVDTYNFLLKHNVNILCNVEILDTGINMLLENNSFEKDQLIYLKRLCILSVLKLCNTVLHNNILLKDYMNLWSNDMWKFMENIVFAPHVMGITELNESEYVNLTTVVLNAIPIKVPDIYLSLFITVLDKYIEINLRTTNNLKSTIDLKQRNLLRGIVHLNSTKLKDALKLERYAKGMVSRLIDNLTEDNKDNIIFIDDLPETVHTYYGNILKFCLSSHAELRKLFDYIHMKNRVNSLESEKNISFGLYILNMFSEAIVPNIFMNFREFLDLSVEKADLREFINLLNFLLNMMFKHRGYRMYHEQVCDELSLKWPIFLKLFISSYENRCLGIEYAKLILQISSKSSGYIYNWLTRCLMEDEKNSLEIFGLLIQASDEDLLDSSDDLENGLLLLKHQIGRSDLTLFDKMLSLMPSVKSSKIFIFLVESYLDIDSRVNILMCLNQFIINSSGELQENLINGFYEMSFDPNIPFEKRYKICKNVLCPLLQLSNLPAVEKFYLSSICNIVKHLKTTNYDFNIKCFLLIEVLFLRIPVGQGMCKVSKAANQNLLQVLMKHGLEAFQVRNQGELIRLFKCHAYNALASIISNTHKLKGFFDKMFVRIDKGNDILWNGIVKLDYTYHFPITFEKLPKQKTVLLNIRDALRKTHHVEINNQYMESQRLFNSSLCEDVTKYDFSNAIARSEKPNRNIDNRQCEIYLDSTDVNDHECIATICCLIANYFNTGANEGTSESILPKWMKGIRDMLLNKETHVNVKIFLVKVIDNTLEYFNPFAKYFLEPLLQFIVEGCAGESINYFLMDVLIILSKWTSKVQDLEDNERYLASEMLKSVIRKINIDRRDIFKFNLDIIKLIVESWGALIDIPREVICELMKIDNTSEAGLQLASIFLINDLKLWDHNEDAAFFDLLMLKLKCPDKSVYRPCSEVMGLLVKHLNGEYLECVNSYLKNVTEFDKYLVCLEGVAIHFPLIINANHACKLISSLNQVPDTQKIVHLKIICRRVSVSLDLLHDIQDFSIIEWCKLLDNASLEIQIISLEIVKKCLTEFVKYSTFPDIIAHLKRNVTNPNALYRSSLYDLIIDLYQQQNKYREDAQEILVHGLADTNFENYEKVMKFWTQNANLPVPVTERLPFLLSQMYNSKIEDHFLGYITYLLLDVLKESDRFKSELFENPLEHCIFEEYKLKTHWKLQNPSTIPLFVQSLQTSNDSDILDSDMNPLRKTQTASEFNSTQNVQEQLSMFTLLESSLSVYSCASEANIKQLNAKILPEKYAQRKRFLKDQYKISNSFANYETKKKVERVQNRFDLAMEREKKVTIYRSYRKGDFPDIQILLSSLIEPIQMLALHDNELSKSLFVEIFKGVAKKIENDAFLKIISNSIKEIFHNTSGYNNYLIAALLDILLVYKDKIQLDPNLITCVCQESGLISIGALLLEEYIMCYDYDGPTSKKRLGSQNNVETLYWVKLAELYKVLEEWDIVHAIFLEKMNCKDTIHNALKFESEGIWRLAQESYEKLIRNDMCDTRKDFYYDSYFKCFANIGEWDKLPTAITSILDSNDTWHSLWYDNWSRQKLLPWYIRSHVCNGLFYKQFNSKFLEDVNSSLTDSNQAEYFKSKFSEELCIMWLFNKDMPAAKIYLQSYIEYFLDEWQSLNPIHHSLRFNKLLKLRNIIEAGDFINIYNNLAEHMNTSLNMYLRRWRTEMLPTIVLNETRMLYRSQFINLLVDKLKTFSGIDVQDQVTNLRKESVKMNIDFINIATVFENFYVAKKYYMHKFKNTEHSKLKLAYGDIVVSKVKSRRFSKPEEIKICLDAIRIYKSILVPSLNKLTALTVNTKLFDLFTRVIVILQELPHLYKTHESALTEITGSRINSTHYIENYAIDMLKSSINSFNEEMVSDNCCADILRDIAQAYIKLAYYIQNNGNEAYLYDFVLFVLRAMRMNSADARKLFPCILMLDNIATDAETFLKETEQIPTWMFIGWIPQLLAVVDSTKVTTVSRILTKIAQLYPQAIMYAYRLSRHNYKLNKRSSVNDEVKQLINRLDELLLEDKTVNMFLNALSFVNVPTVTLRSYIIRMIKGADINTTLAKVDKMFDGKNESSDITNMKGNIYKNVENYRRKFFKLKGLCGQILLDELRGLEDQLKNEVNIATFKPSLLLKDYCPWLANFSINMPDVELEVPGQYDGEQLPLHHVKIYGFCPDVKIMTSIRRPIKIKMLGTDTKEYPFLIKFGEDVRQDQRIEQLFALMNNIYNSDKSTNDGFDILTYQVIPLDSNLGLIQWVDNTVVLKSFVLQSFTKEEEKCLAKTCKEYEKFISVNSKYTIQPELYARNQSIPKFNEFINRFPKDLLKKSFWKLNISVENYIVLKNNFIKSYSVLCASHWILGIGDRHLDNFLICVNNGKVLGIDFELAFGIGTQFQSLPELVPFRLTPLIVNFMQPLGERGQFKQNMIHCLQALRANYDSLIATMNVFIKEPTLDWLDHAGADIQGRGNWWPNVKIEQAKRKILGASSVQIINEELEARPKAEKAIEEWKWMVKGCQTDIRFRFIGSQFLIVEDQVDCLIDHASDYNLLARSFVGWLPWI